MPDVQMPPDPRPWYVIRTHPRQEVRAEQNLRRGGIDVFLPQMHVCGSRKRRGHAEAAPLFPQYLFACFDAPSRLRDVSFTRGVQAALRVGENLAVVDEAAVAFLRSRMDASGLIRVGDPLRPGETVMIQEGPFAALTGIVERLIPERERVIILLTAVSSPLRLDLEVDSVRRVAAVVAAA